MKGGEKVLKTQLEKTIQPSVQSAFFPGTKTNVNVFSSRNQQDDFKAVFEKYSQTAKSPSRRADFSKDSANRFDKFNECRSESLSSDKKITPKNNIHQLSIKKTENEAQLEGFLDENACTINVKTKDLLALLAELSELISQMGNNGADAEQLKPLPDSQGMKDNSLQAKMSQILEQLSDFIKQNNFAMLYAKDSIEASVAGFSSKNSDDIADFFAKQHDRGVLSLQNNSIDAQLKDQITDLMNILNAKIIAASEAESEGLGLQTQKVNDIITFINQKLAEYKNKTGDIRQSKQGQENSEILINDNTNAIQNVPYADDKNNEDLTWQNNMLNANVSSNDIGDAQNSANKVQSHPSNFARMLQKINNDEIIGQVVKKIASSNVSNKAEMVLELKPESLGKLTLKIVSENGLIAARFMAENNHVKQIIESNFQMLKDALEQKGYTVQGFSVSVGQDSAERPDQSYNQSFSTPTFKQSVEEDIAVHNYATSEHMLKSNYLGFTSSKIDFTA